MIRSERTSGDGEEWQGIRRRLVGWRVGDVVTLGGWVVVVDWKVKREGARGGGEGGGGEVWIWTS